MACTEMVTILKCFSQKFHWLSQLNGNKDNVGVERVFWKIHRAINCIDNSVQRKWCDYEQKINAHGYVTKTNQKICVANLFDYKKIAKKKIS